MRFDDYLFRQHQYIDIYPSIFFNSIIQKKLKGGTTKKKIMLSWNDTLKGFDDAHDKLNLALHEFAHALKISAAQQTEFLDNFGLYFKNWKTIAEKERLKLKNQEDPFLRRYAEVNADEFFAVSVEHFFEAPVEFKQRMPHIYNNLCMLLNLDLTNVKHDYKVQIQQKNRLIRLKESNQIISEKEFNKGWNYFSTLIIVGVLVGFPAFSIAFEAFYIPSDLILKVFITIAFVGLISNYRVLVRKKIVSPFLYVIFNLVGFSPTFTALFFVLNFIPTGEYKTEYIPVKSGKVFKHTTVIKLNSNPYPHIPDLKTVILDLDDHKKHQQNWLLFGK